jgi:hypothetical protein
MVFGVSPPSTAHKLIEIKDKTSHERPSSG